MRKTLVTILSLLLTVGFSASAFAGHAADAGYEYTPKLVKAGKSNIDLSGSIRIRGELRDNVDFNSEVADYRSAYDQRVRVKLDATVSPNTMGVIELETGVYSGGDTYEWGDWSNARGTLSGNINDDGNYKPDVLDIRQAYIAHQGTDLLGTLAGFKAGHILTKYGNGVFYNHSKYGDDAIVLWTTPQKGTEVSLTMAKLGEGVNTRNDDTTSYTVAATTGMNGINLGADLTYIDDQQNTLIAPNVTHGLHLWNLGLNANTDVNGIALYGDLEIQSGKTKQAYREPFNGARSDLKNKGYAWVLGAKMDVPNSPISAGLETGYGSGDKVEDCSNPPTCTTKNTGTKNEAFLTTIGSSGNVGVRQIAYLYDDKVATASGALNSGLSNMWYINLGGDADINPDLNVALDIFYMRAAKARAIGGAMEANGMPKTSKNIGTEVDAKLTYQLDTNLVYYVEGGYLFAGSMYDYDDTRTAAAALIFGDNLRADNPYGIRNGLELTF